MKIKTITNYFNDENTYIVYDESKKTGIVIDPGCGAEQIGEFIKNEGISLKYIFLTHCHYDHISDITELKEKYGLKIIGGRECEKNLFDTTVNLTEAGLGYKISEKPDIILADNETLSVDGMMFKCIYTPGHTSCSVCYLCEDNLFSGDTLFLRSVGRWDLPTGNLKDIENSLRKKIYTLGDNINVFPGHGNKTTVGYEKKFNLLVKAQ